MTRHYQQVLRLQPLVERLAVDRQAFEPEPEEEGAFRLVDVEARIGNGFSQQLDREVGLLLVEGFHHLFAQGDDLAALYHGDGDGGPQAARRQVDDAAQVGDGLDDLLVGDDDAAAGARQAQLGEAHAEYGVGIPERLGLAEDDAGEGHTIGVVEQQRDPLVAGDLIQVLYLFIGQHVACGVGGARDADHSDVVAYLQTLEIHMVFELAVGQLLYGGLVGDEVILRQGRVRIADVFGGQGEEHLLLAAIGELAGQQVEQIEEGILAAIGQGYVAGRDVPAQLSLEQGGQRLGEPVLALRAIVVGHGLDQLAIVEQLLGLGLKAFQHGGDGGRIAASEHDGVRIEQPLIEVIHELGNTGVASELLAEQGEFHSVTDPESVTGELAP